jgi:hypothetical protein
MGVGLVGFWVFGFLGERGRETMQGNNLLIPLLVRVHGKKKMHSVIQNSTVLSIFFLMNKE